MVRAKTKVAEGLWGKRRDTKQWEIIPGSATAMARGGGSLFLRDHLHLREVYSHTYWGQMRPAKNVMPKRAMVLRRAPKRAARNPGARYIYPKTKTFPVHDATHERRALAYVKAGRASVEQALEVPAWLAKHAKDQAVKAEAKAVVRAWKAKGTGAIAEGLRAMRRRAKTRAKKNPDRMKVRVFQHGKGWRAEPVGEGPQWSLMRRMLMAAGLSSPSSDRARKVARIAKSSVALDAPTQAAMEMMARRLHFDIDTIATLESGRAATVSIPVHRYERVLHEAAGLAAVA